MNTAAHKAQLRIDLNQKKIFGPVVNDIETYLKFMTPGNKCNADQYISCVIQDNHGFDAEDIGNCHEKSQCTTKWGNLGDEGRAHVM